MEEELPPGTGFIWYLVFVLKFLDVVLCLLLLFPDASADVVDNRPLDEKIGDKVCSIVLLC
jgi:hypothetical protein